MKHRRDGGFAMLVVFLLAACVAITMYMEIPRVAFEAERQRELLLVDRGNQFKRAIQVFCTDKTNNPTHRYPASLDELESFNGHRYLRHKYVDPMTGKDEWRLVHINGGVLTDSVTTQQNPANTQNASTGPQVPAYVTGTAYMNDEGAGGAGGTRGGGVARAMRERPSDSLAPGGSGDPAMAAGGSAGMEGNANGANPGGVSALVGVNTGQPGQNGIPAIPGLPGIPGSQNPGSPGATAPPAPTCTVYVGTCPTPATTQGAPPIPGGIGQPGSVVGMPAGAVPVNGSPQGFNLGGVPQAGQGGSQVPAQAQSAAASMINNLLTTPRPGGMPSPMGSTVGAGIAGVASKFEAEGIMVINDRTAINEWEYIFDLNKFRAPPNPVSGAVGNPLQPMQGGGTGTPIGPTGMTPAGPTGPGSLGAPTSGGGRGQ